MCVAVLLLLYEFIREILSHSGINEDPSLVGGPSTGICKYNATHHLLVYLPFVQHHCCCLLSDWSRLASRLAVFSGKRHQTKRRSRATARADPQVPQRVEVRVRVWISVVIGL